MKDTERRLWEQALVIRCQAGDDTAFSELVRAFHGGLARYVGHIMGRPDVDDLLQQVWLDVYLKLHTLRSVKAFRAWIYRIARDKAYASCRRRRCLTVEYRDDEASRDVQDEPVFSQEEIAGVRLCLQRLSIKHRDVLVLRFFENMAYEEIATTLRCQIGTVRSRMYYARRALRHEMEVLKNDNGTGQQ